MKRSYTFRFDCLPDVAIKNLSQLLSLRCVEHNVVSNKIISKNIPVLLASWDSNMYSRDNWVGVNPFFLLDRFKATSTQENDTTKVLVSVLSFRVYFILILPLFPTVSCWIDGEAVGRNLFGGIALLLWVVIFFGVFGEALPGEIKKAFQPGNREVREKAGEVK